MKYEIKMCDNSVDLLDFSSRNEVGFAAIRFKTDPVTGYFFKCPHCNQIHDIEGNEIPKFLRCKECEYDIELNVKTD